jgi:subtilisin family serine protease
MHLAAAGRSSRTLVAVAFALLAAFAALAIAASTPHARSLARLTGTSFSLAKPKPPAARKAGAPVLRHVQSRARRTAVTRRPAAPTLPDDPLLSDAWALRAIGAPSAWSRTTGSAAAIVAVLDTGVDGGHPDLAGALVGGVDLVSDDADPQDDHGHGTMVAGLVAARAGNGLGAAGICARCSIMPVKVIGADGVGSSGDIAAGLRWAVDHGADVVNMSFVLSATDGAVTEAIRYARERGVVVVAAAGNSAATSPVFPAAEPGVLSVAATNEADVPYAWTGRGPWVRVAAPGCAPTTTLGGSFASLCGTSAATAVVSGLAGLGLSARPGAAGGEVERAIEAGARAIGDVVAAGRVDAAATVDLLAPAPPEASYESAGGLRFVRSDA